MDSCSLKKQRQRSTSRSRSPLVLRRLWALTGGGVCIALFVYTTLVLRIRDEIALAADLGGAGVAIIPSASASGAAAVTGQLEATATTGVHVGEEEIPFAKNEPEGVVKVVVLDNNDKAHPLPQAVIVAVQEVVREADSSSPRTRAIEERTITVNENGPENVVKMLDNDKTAFANHANKPPLVQAVVGTIASEQPSAKKKEPTIVWLLSFPNSGTSYTITNTEAMSNRSTATNYPDERACYLPVLEGDMNQNGPFVHDATLERPAQILTKTHCGGYCDYCRPKLYVHTVDSFETECASGEQLIGGNVVRPKYNATIVTKMVHLVRNPFDNMVSRLHLGVKTLRQQQKRKTSFLDKFTTSSQGLDMWCNYVDNRFPWGSEHKKLLDADMMKKYADLPCRSEWFRYLQWHTLAGKLGKRRGLPVHVLHYEDYTNDFNGTIASLFTFLDLGIVQEPLPFSVGKTYLNIFDVHHKKRAAEFVQEYADPETWALLKHYFVTVDHLA